MSDQALTPLAKPANALVSPRLKRMHETWRRAAAGRFAPDRGEMVLSKFASEMPSLFVMDVVEEGRDVRFRFAGDRIVQFMGGRHNRRMLSELRGPQFFEVMHRLVAQLVETKSPLARGPVKSTRTGKEFVEIEVLMLPVSDDGASVTAIFGAVDIKSN